MNRRNKKMLSSSIERVGSYNVLEELGKTRLEMASVFSPTNSLCSSPTYSSPKKKMPTVKEAVYGKLPPISVHRNPMSLLSGREIGYEWKKKYKPSNKSRLRQWAVNKNIMHRGINLDRAESYLENHGVRFSHYLSHPNL